LAASGDISQIVLQMPDAAAQPMVDPLLRHGILCFKGGVRGDAHGYFFSPKISSGSRSRLEETRRGKHMTADEGKKQIRRKLTLEWCASLMKSCHP
jgi:hypothetical protein